MLPYINNIVITDSLTGNPALERQNVDLAHITESRYIGDEKILDFFRDFLRNQRIGQAKIENFQQLTTSDTRGMVYFYEDGDVHLRYDKTLVFDLKRRERSDLHFEALCRELEQILYRHPLRFSQEQIEQPGFLVLEGSVVFFHRGSFLSWGLPEQYFGRYVHQGLDPDALSGVITERLSASLMDLLKRKAYTGDPLRVYSGRDESIGLAVKLYRNLGEQEGEGIAVTSADTFSHLGMSFQRGKGSLTMNVARHPTSMTVSSGAAERDGGAPEGKSRLHLSLAGLELSLADGTDLGPVPPGMPHVLERKLPSKAELLRLYYSDLLPFFKGRVSLSEAGLLQDVESVLRALLKGGESGESSASAERRLASLSSLSGSATVYPLRNALQLLALFGGERREDAASLMERLDGKLGAAGSALPEGFPLRCDLFLERDTPYRMFRLLRAEITEEDVAQAATLLAEFDRKLVQKEEFYLRERKRLVALVDQLSPRAAAAVPGTAAAAAAGSAARPAEPAAAAPEAAAPKGPSPEAARPAKISSASRSRGGGWLLVAALILLLLLAGGGALYYFGPFGGSRDGGGPIARETGPGTTGPGITVPGTAAPGTGDGRADGTDAVPGGTEGAVVGPDAGDQAASGAETGAGVTGTGAAGPDGTPGTEAAGGGPAAPGTTEAPGGPEAPGEAGAGIAAGPEAPAAGPAHDAGRPAAAVPAVEPGADDAPFDRDRIGDPGSFDGPMIRGGVRITMMDVYLLANKIAVLNGYREMQSPREAERNPHRIFPGNSLELPNRDAPYEITDGDTIWGIAVTLIKQNLDEGFEAYLRIVPEGGPGSPEERARIREQLHLLRQFSYSENFIRKVDREIGDLRSGL